MILGLYRQLFLPIFLKVYSSVFIHYDNPLTCAYTPIHADTAAGIIVGVHPFLLLNTCLPLHFLDLNYASTKLLNLSLSNFLIHHSFEPLTIKPITLYIDVASLSCGSSGNIASTAAEQGSGRHARACYILHTGAI
jgi:hypothetical protein